ncbi:Exonuclease VII, large subunit [seawater metagenome]|uniref:Exonuclease VII, large subunit n=1 Tax=seawater metagenome TaxID=1561972 RepID=A0A5E8CM30_9ZZZZ
MKLSISELNDMINLGIENAFPKNIKLTGEISNLRNSRGHLYMNLKDSDSLIKAIMWKSTYNELDVELNEGNKVDIIGHLNYYVPSGSISFIIKKVEVKKDIGKIKQQYEELKEKYKQLGYFDPQNKKKPPSNIKKVTIITSQDGAALQDILYTFKRHELKIEIKVINAIVQGKNCPKDVSVAMSKIEEDSDVILLTRGGGDMEDLFGFSNPLVIEAIHNCNIFTISAVGHEIDFMLSDFVADHRAPTPSLAAEFIVHNNRKMNENINELERKILDILKERFNKIKLFLLNCENKLENPIEIINNIEEKVLYLLANKMGLYKKQIQLYTQQIDILAPNKDVTKLFINNKSINSLRAFKKAIKTDTTAKLMFYDGEIEIIINKK